VLALFVEPAVAHLGPPAAASLPTGIMTGSLARNKRRLDGSGISGIESLPPASESPAPDPESDYRKFFRFDPTCGQVGTPRPANGVCGCNAGPWFRIACMEFRNGCRDFRIGRPRS